MSPTRTTRRRYGVLLLAVAGAAALGWMKREWLIAKGYLLILETDGRVQDLQIDRVIDALGVGPGSRVADIGAGTGVFARPFARAVGEEGTVYAVDVNRELLEHVEATAAAEGLTRLRAVLAAGDDPRLPEPVELVFMCDTLHHIPEPARYLETLRRYLVPEGRIAVVDFRAGHSPHLSGYSREELDDWMEAAGFVLERSHEFLEDNFFVVYLCRGCPHPGPSPPG